MRFGFREMMFVLVLLAMPAAAYFFVFEPRRAQITAARAEIAAKEAKLRQLEAATRSIEDLGAEIERLSEVIQVFETRLPAEREVEVILKGVWELAAKHGLKPRSVRTDKPVPAVYYTELPIRMVILGDFDGFYSFLLDLEQLPRITRTPAMKLSKQPTQEGQLQADIVLSIFFESKKVAGPGGAGVAGKSPL